MSHVDDGLIHAWLDGALFAGDPKRTAFEKHLELCDECRDRVEAERRVRDRAADVLRSAAPDAVRVEPFEQMIAARLAARAAAAAGPAARDDVPGRVDSATPVTTAPSHRRRRFVPLAWAASLLMAVTAGWFARVYLPVRSASSDQVAERPATESDVAPTAAAPITDAMRRSEPAADTASREAGVQAAGGGVAAARDQAVGNLAAGEAKAAAKTEAETRMADTVTVGGMRRPTEETRRLANAMMADETTQAKPLVVQPASPARLARETAGESVQVIDALRTARWEPVTEAVAAERLGRAPARIEGLPVDSLVAAPYADGWAVKVVQLLGPGGATAEILQWPMAVQMNELVVTAQAEAGRGVTADSARQRVESAVRRAEVMIPAAAPPPSLRPDDRPTLQLDVIGYRVLIRADVSPDSLRALSTRVR